MKISSELLADWNENDMNRKSPARSLPFAGDYEYNMTVYDMGTYYEYSAHVITFQK